MKILVTGSSGTIGTRLTEKLVQHHEVIGADIRENKWRPESNRTTIRIDLREANELDKLPRDIDLVVHFAANARVYDLVKDPRQALDNMIINFNVAEFARTTKGRKVIFASSREVYGNITQKDALAEDRARLENCESPYSCSKLSGEALLHAYNKSYGLDFINIRFSNVYGMYDDSDRVIPLWIRQSLRNEDLTVFGKIKLLDFTYIDDTVDGVIRMIEQFDKVKGNTINIAYGRGVQLLRVAESIVKLLESNNKILISDSRVGEVFWFEADISRAKELLGYRPRVPIEEGLKKTVEWYRQNT